MDVRNLVLEIGESESAADVQTRLDKAAEGGYFLVNVVGRLAFLRTTVTPRKPEPVPAQSLQHRQSRPEIQASRDSKDEAANAYLKANPDATLPELVKGLAVLGIDRKKTWVSEHRAKLGGNGASQTE